MKNKSLRAFIKEVYLNNKIAFVLALLFCLISEVAIVLMQKTKGNLVNSATKLVTDYNFYNFSNLKEELFLFIILLLIIPSSFWIFSRLFYRVQVNSINKLRQKMFERILAKSYPEFIKNDQGKYLNAYTSELLRLEYNFFVCMFGFLQIVACLIATLPMLFVLDRVFIISGVLAVSLAIIIPKLLQKKVKKIEQNVIESSEKNLTLLNEILDGIETIFNFEQKKLFMKKFKHTTNDLAQDKHKSSKYIAFTFQLTNLILHLFTAVLIIIAAYFVYIKRLSIGGYVLSIGILNNLIMNVPYTSFYLQSFDLVDENVKYIEQIIESQGSLKTKNVFISEVEAIEFKNVYFKYPSADNNILENFSHVFDKMGIIEINGESGSGKSTLFNLLFNYYAVNQGKILINNSEVGNIKNLNEIITVMRQDSIFFAGSLKDNITMFEEIADEEIICLMQELGLEKYANKKTLYSEDFVFSGGEERRIMFLRAVLKKTDILILDEPLANLDENSIEKIENFISKIDDQFVFVITHQPLSIEFTDSLHLA